MNLSSLAILLSLSFLYAIDEIGQIDVVGLEGSFEDPQIDLEASYDDPQILLDDKRPISRNLNGQVVIPTDPVTLTMFNTVHVFGPVPTATPNKLKARNVNGQVVVPTAPVTISFFNTVHVFGPAPTPTP